MPLAGARVRRLAMLKSFQEELPQPLRAQLPGLVAAGRRAAQQLLDQASGRRSPPLRSCEWVLPVADTGLLEWIVRNGQGRRNAAKRKQPGRLIQGRDLWVITALLADGTASMRYRMGLVCLDLAGMPADDSGAEFAVEKGEVRRVLSDSQDAFRPLRQVPPSPAGAALPESGIIDLASRLRLVQLLLDRKGTVCLRVDPIAVPLALAVIAELFSGQTAFGKLLGRQATPPAFRLLGDGIILFCPGQKSERSLPDNLSSTPRAGIPPAFDNVLEDLVSCTGDSQAAFFGIAAAGAANAAALADRLGRHWIASAREPAEAGQLRARLLRQEVQPFLFQIVEESEERPPNAPALLSNGLQRSVLTLYGAQPLAPDRNPGHDLGQVIDDETRTLVLAGLPGHPVDAQSVARLVALRDAPADAWDRAVLLGWEFDPEVAAGAAARDSRLELVRISADLFEVLNSNGATGKLEGKPCFLPVKP